MNIGWQDVGVAVIVVLAVMFLYRQFLELSIKGLIRSAWSLFDEEAKDDLI